MSLKKLALFSSLFVILFFSIQAYTQTNNLKPNVINRDYKEMNKKDKWEINVAYPEIQFSNKKAAQSFNARSKKEVMESVADFKKMFLNEIIENSAPYYLTISYQVEFINQHLISVLFNYSSYTGGAHGIYSTYTLNYDLKNNKVLALPDLFKKGANFLPIISKQSIAQILAKQGGASSEWVEEGASAHLQNFTHWNITPKGLLFSFDPYQVASYAEGSFTTVIPYSVFPAKIKQPIFLAIPAH
ncbi:MAG: DUF3298 and DUF4163 domain-containing protein [Methylococcales bacterium]|nr:DUF3298 and DUF4163 domain-containing protein [Methylococcales bacterium]